MVTSVKHEPCDYILMDISNMLYRSFFANKTENEATIAGMAAHMALVTMNKYFKMFKPRKKVVMAFDRKSWRKEYTASAECLSKKPYKGNRRQDMTPAQQEKYARFMDHVKQFEQMIMEHTTIISLVEDGLEADDLIAGFCQSPAHANDNIVIISTDSDLLQLVSNQNVRVVSPATDKEQSLADYHNDPAYYIFVKCMRGDPTDNVQSAYPRVQEKRLRKAYTDPFERVQLMKETWTNQDKVEFRVEQMFEENEKLINLQKQPEDIRELITASVAVSMKQPRQFSMFNILKYVGKYKLVKIKEGIEQYVPLLSK